MVIIVLPFLSILLIGTLTTSPYKDTYYGGLSDKYERLNKINDKKIIFVGNSSVTFGLRSDLIEKELPEYKVVNFGLYGSVGTKAMIDLSKSNINKDDIVILMPEISKQSLSMYFNPDVMLECLDNNWNMYNSLQKNDKKSVAYHYFSFFINKMEYLSGAKRIVLDNVYARENMNEYGDIAYYKRDENHNIIRDDDGIPISLRTYNIMPKMYDESSMVLYDSSIIEKDFINYVNEYASWLRKKGANIYFAFSPSDEPSIISTKAEITDFYWYMRNTLNMPFLGNPFDHIFAPEYFYDSNFHLNDSGAVYNTINIINELKQVLKNDTKTNIPIPNPPEIPHDEDSDVDSPTASYFTYEDYLDYKGDKLGLQIVGVKEEHINDSEIELPRYYGGYSIMVIAPDAFKEMPNLKTVHLNKNLKIISSRAFEGCKVLEKIIVPESMSPSDCFVPFDIEVEKTNSMLYGCNEGVKILIPKDKYGSYDLDYYWSRYSTHFLTY